MYFLKSDFFNKVGTLLIILGVITGAVTWLTGDGAEEFAFDNWGRAVHDAVELHSLFSYISIILFGVVAAIKVLFKHPIFKFRILEHSMFKPELIMTFIVILSISGIITLAITGHLGGEIVYENKMIQMNTTNDLNN